MRIHNNTENQNGLGIKRREPIITIDQDTESGIKDTKTILWSEPAATLELSAEGMKKAGSVNLSDIGTEMQMLGRTVDVKEASYFKAEERTEEELWASVYRGEEITSDEANQLLDGMKSQVQEQYENMLDYKIPMSDEIWSRIQKKEDGEKTRDEKALEELYEKLNLAQLMKQRTLQDMQEELEREKLEQSSQEEEAKFAQQSWDISSKVSELEMLQNSLGEYEETSDKSIDGDEREKENKQTLEADKSEAGVNEKIQQMDVQNQENLEQLKQEKADAVGNEKEYSQMLEQTYAETMKLLQAKEVSLAEKRKACEHFEYASKEIAIGREIEEQLKIFHTQAIVDAKINLLSINHSQDMQENLVNNEVLRDIGQGVIENMAKNNIEEVKERLQTKEKQKNKEEDKYEIVGGEL